MKLKGLVGKLILIIVAVGILGAGLVFRGQLMAGKKPDMTTVVSTLKGLAKGINLDINTKDLVNQAQRKLVDRQAIIDDESKPEGEVAGASITLSDQTRKVVQDAAQKAYQSFQNLPKDQAAKLTRQVCDQIVTELEKSAAQPTPTSSE